MKPKEIPGYPKSFGVTCTVMVGVCLLASLVMGWIGNLMTAFLIGSFTGTARDFPVKWKIAGVIALVIGTVLAQYRSMDWWTWPFGASLLLTGVFYAGGYFTNRR